MNAGREKIFNLPGVVTGVIATLFAFQLAITLLPEPLAGEIFDMLAFVPARVSFPFAPQSVLASLESTTAQGPAGEELTGVLLTPGHGWWTLLTYALLHGGWTHLLVNCVTLAAFGAPVARRFGDRRFVLFLATAALAGALLHLALYPLAFTPVVGASAAISGAMAAVARFAFSPGAPLSDVGGSRTASVSDDASLTALMRNRRAIFFLGVWFGVNLLFGLAPDASGSPHPIAWEAHIGGFLAGLFLFDLFDRRTAIPREA